MTPSPMRARNASAPTSPAPSALPGSESAPQPAPARPGNPKRILLVDDDVLVRDSLNEVLLSEGYVVIPAPDGQRAMNVARQAPIDLVLLDLNMPGKNGWDTFEELTREHPLLPIVIVTARPNQLFMALSAGVGALFEKPMEIPTLLETLKKLLAETPEQRLARLVGHDPRFTYQPMAAARQESPASSQD